jgi:ribosome biogenesis protein MAK21
MIDRISALTTIIQRSPSQSLSYLSSLVNLAKKKNRKQVEAAINQARDLFTDVLLPDDKKLTSFSKNPMLGKNTTDQQLILQAYYEHRLKELYSEYLSVLKGLASDDLEFYRKFALNYLQGLLEKKPEQEEMILDVLVNKLGDS